MGIIYLLFSYYYFFQNSLRLPLKLFGGANSISGPQGLKYDRRNVVGEMLEEACAQIWIHDA